MAFAIMVEYDSQIMYLGCDKKYFMDYTNRRDFSQLESSFENS